MSNNNNDGPIGGGGGLPEPKEPRSHGKLPGLTHRQTYKFINAIPVILLGICFTAFFLTATNIYEISYVYLSDFVGFSLLTGIHQWYTSKFIGSCGGTLMAIYALLLLNVVNIANFIFVFDYYGIYGLITTGVGLLFFVIFNRRRINKK